MSVEPEKGLIIIDPVLDVDITFFSRDPIIYQIHKVMMLDTKISANTCYFKTFEFARPIAEAVKALIKK